MIHSARILWLHFWNFRGRCNDYACWVHKPKLHLFDLSWICCTKNRTTGLWAIVDCRHNECSDWQLCGDWCIGASHSGLARHFFNKLLDSSHQPLSSSVIVHLHPHLYYYHSSDFKHRISLSQTFWNTKTTLVTVALRTQALKLVMIIC